MRYATRAMLLAALHAQGQESFQEAHQCLMRAHFQAGLLACQPVQAPRVPVAQVVHMSVLLTETQACVDAMLSKNTLHALGTCMQARICTRLLRAGLHELASASEDLLQWTPSSSHACPAAGGQHVCGAAA